MENTLIYCYLTYSLAMAARNVFITKLNPLAVFIVTPLVPIMCLYALVFGPIYGYIVAINSYGFPSNESFYGKIQFLIGAMLAGIHIFICVFLSLLSPIPYGNLFL